MQASTDLLCIKNDCYREFQVSSSKFQARDARLFAEGGRRMLVVYNEEAIPAVVEWLQEEFLISGFKVQDSGQKRQDDRDIEQEKIRTYVFSPSSYAWDDDFAPVAHLVELCALPDAIYQAYRHVLPRRTAQQTIDRTVAEQEAIRMEEKC